jgi:hypothetical protein
MWQSYGLLIEISDRIPKYKRGISFLVIIEDGIYRQVKCDTFSIVNVFVFSITPHYRQKLRITWRQESDLNR